MSFSLISPSKHKEAGFTVIELMAAAIITALIGAALVMVASNATILWKRGTGVMSIDNRANFVLDILEKDLGSIIWNVNNPEEGFEARIRNNTSNLTAWRYTDTSGSGSRGWEGLNSTHLRPTGSSSLVLTGDILNRRFGQGGIQLTFIARTSDGDSPRIMGMAPEGPQHLPTMISYQIVRQEESWGPMKNSWYRLFRSVVRPGPQEGGSEGEEDNFYKLGADLTNSKYRPTSLSHKNDRFHPETLSIPHPDMVLADGIVDFGIVAFNEKGEEIPYQSNEVISSNDILKIRSVVVLIRLLTEDGVQALSQYEANGGTGDWWDDVVIPNSKVYLRRIPIRVTPL